jgi:hypothetical protein
MQAEGFGLLDHHQRILGVRAGEREHLSHQVAAGRVDGGVAELLEQRVDSGVALGR